MQAIFDITQTSRNSIVKFLENYTSEQLNRIPTGFNNNIIWNIGHIIVVQQMLVYKLAGLPMMISDEMVEKYKRGTKPEGIVSDAEIAEIRELLFTTLDKVREDFRDGIFQEYQEFTTMSGYTIQNSADAMAFNYYHEGTHTGMMLSIRKFL